MFPTLKDKEYLLTDKLSYQLGQIKRGDIVVFKAPESEPCAESGCEYIKRVLGIPGDRVMVSGSKVFINGKMANDSFLPPEFVTHPGAYMKEGVEIVVPEGRILPLGDNREHSRDGREFGPIKKELVVGRAFFRYWPVNVFGLLPSVAL
jgi:signal peptidase I